MRFFFCLVAIYTFSFLKAQTFEKEAAQKIRVIAYPETKDLLINQIEAFLEAKNWKNADLVDQKDLEQFEYIYEIINETLQEKPDIRLINVVPQEQADHFLVSLSFTKDQELQVIASMLATPTKKGFVFSTPFRTNTKGWKSKKIGAVQFYYKYQFNKKIAKDFSRYNKFIAQKLSHQILPIKYYKCRDLQEVYALFGIEYYRSINGDKRGCITIDKNHFFVSGTGTEEYKHDLTHYYFAKVIPDSTKNWVAEEGFNINLTDYWGESTAANYRYLKAFLIKNEQITPLEIFKKNRYLKRPIPTKMPVAAVIMKKIEEGYGMNMVLKMISCGKTDEDFFNALKKYCNIDENKFNQIVYEELGIK